MSKTGSPWREIFYYSSSCFSFQVRVATNKKFKNLINRKPYSNIFQIIFEKLSWITELHELNLWILHLADIQKSWKNRRVLITFFFSVLILLYINKYFSKLLLCIFILQPSSAMLLFAQTCFFSIYCLPRRGPMFRLLLPIGGKSNELNSSHNTIFCGWSTK